MAQEVEARVELRSFTGLESANGPHDLRPGGTQKQVNIASRTKGLLEVRRGTRKILFEE